MTRSDIILALGRCKTKGDWKNLALILHKKLENTYGLLFELEEATKDEKDAIEIGFRDIARSLRHRLEK